MKPVVIASMKGMQRFTVSALLEHYSTRLNRLRFGFGAAIRQKGGAERSIATVKPAFAPGAR
jgi:hypothetical protein